MVYLGAGGVRYISWRNYESHFSYNVIKVLAKEFEKLPHENTSTFRSGNTGLR